MMGFAFGGPPYPRTDNEIRRLLGKRLADGVEAKRDCRECGTMYEDRYAKVETNMPFALALSMTSSWSGASRPWSFTEYVNYDPLSGREIRLADVFKSTSIPALTRMTEKLFRETRVLTADQSLRDAGFFGETGLFSLGNFVLNERTLAFWYDLGEIATYAHGPTWVEIPYRDLRRFLRSDSGILPFAK
jgi:hypothetical protein